MDWNLYQYAVQADVQRSYRIRSALKFDDCYQTTSPRDWYAESQSYNRIWCLRD